MSVSGTDHLALAIAAADRTQWRRTSVEGISFNFPVGCDRSEPLPPHPKPGLRFCPFVLAQSTAHRTPCPAMASRPTRFSRPSPRRQRNLDHPGPPGRERDRRHRSPSEPGRPARGPQLPASFQVVQSVRQGNRCSVGVRLRGRRAPPDPEKGLLQLPSITSANPVVFLNFMLQLKPGKQQRRWRLFRINTTHWRRRLDVAKRKATNLPTAHASPITQVHHGVKPVTHSCYLPLIPPHILFL